MSKIQKITVKNLKAISEKEIDLNGCSVILTGANQKGKTTILTSIPDRIRGEKPEIIVKEGEVNGSAEMVLTTGEKFIWTFDNKTEKIVFVTKEGFKTPCTREISKRFFPELFDIDSFLRQQPKEQTKTLQRILGIDTTAIDIQYKSAYDDRTYLNKKRDEAKAQLGSFNPIPVKKEAVNIEVLIKEKEVIRVKLNKLYLENKAANDKLRTEFEKKKSDDREAVTTFNQLQTEKQTDIDTLSNAIEDVLTIATRNNIHTLIDFTKANDLLSKLPKPEPVKTFAIFDEPEYIVEMPDNSELKEIDEKINSASLENASNSDYDKYITIKETFEKAEKEASEADVKVKDIEKQKKDIIKAAKLPEGFEITDDGILINGLPLTDKQISTSQKYISALKLAFISIGEVRSMHFDASTLDKFNLKEIETWANDNDLQLLIEKPDFEGGEIKYEFINELK